jgi:PAS domain S-box-containing protein
MVRRSRRLRSFVNQRWLDYTGLSAKQALGSGWQVAMHPDDLPRILETLREALNSAKPFEVEGRFRRFDGEFRWFLFRGSPLRDRSGKVAKWYGTNTDHEERKRAEDALLKSEERWRSVFENSAIGVALTDLNGRFLSTNHVYQTIVGYTEEELRAVNFLDLTHEDYRQANWALITELVEGKRRQFQIEKQYRRKDGTLIWVSNNVSLVPGTERVPRFIMALSEDITQRKRAEEASRKSEALLHEAQRLARTGSWSWDVLSGKVVSSPENARIYDFQPNEDSAAPEVYFQRIHPDHRGRRAAEPRKNPRYSAPQPYCTADSMESGDDSYRCFPSIGRLRLRFPLQSFQGELWTCFSLRDYRACNGAHRRFVRTRRRVHRRRLISSVHLISVRKELGRRRRF